MDASATICNRKIATSFELTGGRRCMRALAYRLVHPPEGKWPRIGRSRHSGLIFEMRKSVAKKDSALPRVRRSVQWVGRRLGPSTLTNLRSVLSYLELGAWVASLPEGSVVIDLQRDVDLFAEALRRTTCSRPLYLEFGVYAGKSMRWWSQHLRQSGATLVGFDSFEGLPEDWRPDIPTGYFATSGTPPEIDDPRVFFVKGLFNETLPAYRMPEHDQLIVNIDCDLYSSAATVLSWLEPHLRPGTLLYFDELPDRDHEMRALKEFLARTDVGLRPIARASGGANWLFELDVSPAQIENGVPVE